MEVELMVTKRDDNQPTDRQGEYRAICLGKVGRQSFAKTKILKVCVFLTKPQPSAVKNPLLADINICYILM